MSLHALVFGIRLSGCDSRLPRLRGSSKKEKAQPTHSPCEFMVRLAQKAQSVRFAGRYGFKSHTVSMLGELLCKHTCNLRVRVPLNPKGFMAELVNALVYQTSIYNAHGLYDSFPFFEISFEWANWGEKTMVRERASEHEKTKSCERAKLHEKTRVRKRAKE